MSNIDLSVLFKDFLSDSQSLLKGSDCIATSHGIAKADINSLFDICNHYYLNGHYDEALTGFSLLCLCQHNKAQNWLGLGYSLLGKKLYPVADQGLAMALSYLEKGSYDWQLCSLNVARCMALNEQPSEALELLETALTDISDVDTLAQSKTLIDYLAHNQ